MSEWLLDEHSNYYMSEWLLVSYMAVQLFDDCHVLAHVVLAVVCKLMLNYLPDITLWCTQKTSSVFNQCL